MAQAPLALHVNVDHVATLRQARGGRSPDPVWAAALCEQAGAEGITVHLREDRRHIQDRDLRLLKETVRGVLNLEMAATDEMVEIARLLAPDVVTLVPEKRQERTTEGGLAVAAARDSIAQATQMLGAAGIAVSLFIDPTDESVDAAVDVGAPRIELHTGDYCGARPGADRARELARLVAAAKRGHAAGLHVAAGHGLEVANVGAVAAVAEIVDLNIGHAIISSAVFMGLPAAVAQMRAAMDHGRQAT